MSDTDDHFTVTDRDAPGPRHADIRAVGLTDVIMYVDEPGARDLAAKLTAWLDAPRLEARKTPTVVARDHALLLVRTACEWGVLPTYAPDEGEEIEPGHMIASDLVNGYGEPLWIIIDADRSGWFAGADAERNARERYADERGKAMCICGAECDEDEIDCSGDEPMCPKCVAEAHEAFKATQFMCGGRECNGNPCTGHINCDWTGTGADLIAAGNLDREDDGRRADPKCNTRSVEEVTP